MSTLDTAFCATGCSAGHRGLTSRVFIKRNHIAQSMSRKGNCWDNAVAESFFKSLKTEAVYDFAFVNRDTMRASVFEYIESYYNTIRRHSANGYETFATTQNYA